MIKESNRVQVREHITLDKYEGELDEDGNPGPDCRCVETVVIEDGKVVEVIDRRPDKDEKKKKETS